MLFVLLILPLVASLKINCTYKSDSWPTTGLAYYCYAQNIEVLSQDDVIKEVAGAHMSGKTNNDVSAIWIEKSPNLLFMPREFENFYKHLMAICINDSGLKRISQKNLQPFPNLEGVWFYGNKLVTFNGDIFQFNPKLRHIDFSHNQIRSIPANVFDPIAERPKVIKFNSNLCINKDVLNYEVEEIKQEILEKCPVAECESLKLENEDLKAMIAKLREDLRSLQDENLRVTVEKLQSEVKRLAENLDQLTTFK